MDPLRIRTQAMLSRRSFLRKSGLLAAGFPLAALTMPVHLRALQDGDAVVPGKERMIVRSLRYLDLEMPVHLLDSWLTPVELFYVRSHYVGAGEPKVSLADWRLRVTGEVERPLELKFEDLEKMEQAAVTNTLECAGNGRAFYRPRLPGIQWTRGAVGNAAFQGARLADVLGRAGLKPSGKHVIFSGVDEPPGDVPRFVRSIPMEKAMHPDTLLASRMNGAPLTIEHGFPLRALVPGWLGAASVKWLEEVRVIEREFDGYFMKPAYRFPRHPVAPGEEVRPEETAVVTGLEVKSIIARPADGSHHKLGPVRLTGAAWAGEADIVRVDVSTDFGRTWTAAELGHEQAKYVWRLWTYTWTPPAVGSYVLISRASDSRGRTQPLVPIWNPSGYLWNAVDEVRIHVEA